MIWKIQQSKIKFWIEASTKGEILAERKTKSPGLLFLFYVRYNFYVNCSEFTVPTYFIAHVNVVFGWLDIWILLCWLCKSPSRDKRSSLAAALHSQCIKVPHSLVLLMRLDNGPKHCSIWYHLFFTLTRIGSGHRLSTCACVAALARWDLLTFVFLLMTLEALQQCFSREKKDICTNVTNGKLLLLLIVGRSSSVSGFIMQLNVIGYSVAY